MIASHICKELYEWILKGKRYGVIHSIFRNSINILGDEGRFISVIAGNKPIGPNGIKIKGDINFANKNLDIGESGIFTETSFRTRDFHIYFGECSSWDNKINTSYKKDSLENVIHKIRLIENFLLHHGNKNGIYNLLPAIIEKFDFQNTLSEKEYILEKKELFIKDRLFIFIENFKNFQLKEINESVKKIIGFGPGLTPSIDDFISGMMIANIYISHFLEMNIENAYRINEEIIRDMKNRTTVVSEEMLRSSSIGEANDDIRSLMINILGISPEGRIYELSKTVSNLGDSSGTDILSGIYIGSLILMDKIKGGNKWE